MTGFEHMQSLVLIDNIFYLIIHSFTHISFYCTISLVRLIVRSVWKLILLLSYTRVQAII